MDSIFEIVPGQSRIVVAGRSSLHPLSFHAPVSGSITIILGSDGLDLSGSVTATIVTSISELASGDSNWDSELRHRMEADRHPVAVATIHSATSNAPDARGDDFILFGELTIRGRSQPLEATAQVTIEDSTASNATLRATGALSFDIRDFGIEPPRLLMVRVHPQITATLELIAVNSSVAVI